VGRRRRRRRRSRQSRRSTAGGLHHTAEEKAPRPRGRAPPLLPSRRSCEGSLAPTPSRRRQLTRPPPVGPALRAPAPPAPPRRLRPPPTPPPTTTTPTAVPPRPTPPHAARTAPYRRPPPSPTPSPPLRPTPTPSCAADGQTATPRSASPQGSREKRAPRRLRSIQGPGRRPTSREFSCGCGRVGQPPGGGGPRETFGRGCRRHRLRRRQRRRSGSGFATSLTPRAPLGPISLPLEESAPGRAGRAAATPRPRLLRHPTRGVPTGRKALGGQGGWGNGEEVRKKGEGWRWGGLERGGQRRGRENVEHMGNNQGGLLASRTEIIAFRLAVPGNGTEEAAQRTEKEGRGAPRRPVPTADAVAGRRRPRRPGRWGAGREEAVSRRGGEERPLTAEAEARFQSRDEADEERGARRGGSRPPHTRCRPSGLARGAVAAPPGTPLH